MTGYNKYLYPQTILLIFLVTLILRQLLPLLSSGDVNYPIILSALNWHSAKNYSRVVAHEGEMLSEIDPGVVKQAPVYQFTPHILSAYIGRWNGKSDDGQNMSKSTAKQPNIREADQPCSAKGWKRVVGCKFSQMRDQLAVSFLQLLPQPHAGVVVAVVLGDKSWLSSQTKPYLETTGTQHLLATSGLHLSLLIGLIGRLLFFTRGRPQALLLWLMALIYLLVVGYKVSLIRAFVMMSLALLAKTWVHRQYNPAYSLLLLAGCMVAWDLGLLTNISFQLSFGATLSIIMFANSIGNLLKLPQVDSLMADVSARSVTTEIFSFWSYLKSMLVVGIAAQLVTSPLVLWHFGLVPLLAFIPSAILGLIMPLLLGAEIIIGTLNLLVLQLFGSQLETAVALQFIGWLPSQLFILILEEIGQFDWWQLVVDQLSMAVILGWLVCLAVLYKLLSNKSSFSQAHLRSNLPCFTSN